jgi:uncharacterized protein (TIGR00299 family) protein
MTSTRIGYLECFAGISGDMLLGALVDAGVPRDLLEETARGLNIGVELNIHSVDRSGIRATKVDVIENGHLAEAPPDNHAHDHDSDHDHDGNKHSHEHHDHSHDHAHAHEQTHSHVHGRSWKEIRDLIHHAPLRQEARDLALRTFELLAHAEARIHGMEVEEVHFHEVGAADTITDIVCAAAGLASLGIDRWHVSAINVGSGFVECAHGTFPVPAPATAELLKGLPTYSAGPKKEMVTPTGAALLKALDCAAGDAPVFTSESIGYGAGSRNPERFPNVLRLNIGQTQISEASLFPDTDVQSIDAPGIGTDTVIVLECAVDDASPQVLAHALALALEQGALDIMAVPVVMKKGRLGTLLTLLARPADAAAIEALLFRETTTLGIRRRSEARSILERSFATVETVYGRIRMKLAGGNAMPEYEDCRRAAREHAAPLKQVMAAAIEAFSRAETRA